jgi:hypothetical protein
MIRVGLRAVAHAKVVDDQTEGDVESFVLKKAGSIGARVVDMFCKVRDKAQLAQTTSLRESVHAFANLEVDSVVVEERFEVVGGDRFSW